MPHATVHDDVEVPAEVADFLVVTALPEEREAVLRQLPGLKRQAAEDGNTLIYYCCKVESVSNDGRKNKYSIVLTSLVDMGRVSAAVAASQALSRWRPRCILMVGISGGFRARGVGLGDIIVSDKVVDYELGKVTEKGTEPRYEVYKADAVLLGAAKHLSDTAWQPRIAVARRGDGKPRVHVGPIASGDKVIADSDFARSHQDVWSKLLGVEMEGGGVAYAVYSAPERHRFLMVRGVSDYADKEKGGEAVDSWRSYACDSAAAYAAALIHDGPIADERAKEASSPASSGSDKGTVHIALRIAAAFAVGVCVLALLGWARGWWIPNSAPPANSDFLKDANVGVVGIGGPGGPGVVGIGGPGGAGVVGIAGHRATNADDDAKIVSLAASIKIEIDQRLQNGAKIVTSGQLAFGRGSQAIARLTESDHHAQPISPDRVRHEFTFELGGADALLGQRVGLLKEVEFAQLRSALPEVGRLLGGRAVIFVNGIRKMEVEIPPQALGPAPVQFDLKGRF